MNLNDFILTEYARTAILRMMPIPIKQTFRNTSLIGQCTQKYFKYKTFHFCYLFAILTEVCCILQRLRLLSLQMDHFSKNRKNKYIFSFLMIFSCKRDVIREKTHFIRCKNKSFGQLIALLVPFFQELTCLPPVL